MIREWPDAGIRLEIADPASLEERGDGVIAVSGTKVDAGRIVALDAVANLDPASSSRLVNGYQSWDYCGIRRATEPGHTWWGGALAGRDGGLAFLAATSDRLATSIRTEPGPGGIRLVALAGGAPDLVPTPPSWGFIPSEATALDLGRHAITASEPILLAADRDPLAAMERVATRVAAAGRARRWDGPPMLGWESWYHYGFSVTPEVVLANARLMRERFPERFALIQIDDGWQHSYGDWTPRDGWPHDLASLVGEIEDHGCFAGLWLAPFMVAPGEPGIGVDHPDWLIGHAASRHPLRDPLMNRHGVDATHPDATAWLRELGTQVRRWGFRMVKLDFLYIGAQEGRRHNPTMTGTEALRAGLRAFIDGVGDDVYVLGCGMPFLPAVGLCHGNRIGGDLAAPRIWDVAELSPFDPEQGWLGIPPTARNVAARWWSHRRLFDNDPDVVMGAGPDDGPPYTTNEAEVLAALATACGGPFFIADDLASLPAAKRAVLEDRRWLDLAWNAESRPLDLFAAPDTAPNPDFYAQPTALPAVWEVAGQRVTFDWARRAVALG